MDAIALSWLLLGAVIGCGAALRRGWSVAGGVLGGALLGPVFAWLLFLVSSVAGEKSTGSALRGDARSPIGIFEVRTLDRQTGEEKLVRVQAISAQDAQAKLVQLGEIAGDARLVDVRA